MKWLKPSPQLLETFEHLLPKTAGVDRRQMFGYPCGFFNGVWFMGCYQENDLVLRLSDQDRQEFLALPEARQFEPMPGRAMREFVMVPQWMFDDEPQLQAWIAKSLEYSLTLPPPTKKKGKKKA